MKKQEQARRRSKFISIGMKLNFNLTVTKADLDQIITNAVKNGIGDWCVLQAPKSKQLKHPFYTLPLEVTEIETNQVYIVTRYKLLRGIRDGLIDFPKALDTRAGYNLNTSNLTSEDIDEIIQLAIFKEIKYGFIG